MFVGICKLDLHLPGNRSLKEKRSQIRKIKDSIRSRFKVSVAEVGENDLWQRAVLGFAVVSNDAAAANSIVDTIINYLKDMHIAELLDCQMEIISF